MSSKAHWTLVQVTTLCDLRPCPGANHAPHHAPQEYIDKYKGKFDDGYEAYRGWVLPRMIAKGILPKDTVLTPINPMPPEIAAPGDQVRPWNSLNADEKRLFSSLAEVYAAFSEYTDAQVGRIIDYLEQTGQLENTLVIYTADNGVSGEGSPSGSVNENKFSNSYPDELSENLKLIDRLGGPDTYEHYPTGWATAFSTPFKMFKRYSEYAGGTCDPLVISWPKGIQARGEVRNQYHHSTDIVPMILEICGLEMPKVYKGVEQYPLSGVSMRYTFEAKPDDPTRKKRQYYCMLGTRGIWENGWKASAGPSAGALEPWQLREGPVGAVPRGRGPLRVQGPGQRAPRETPDADQGVVRGGGEESRAAT
jgi:arylsulfatase A-like enzyme